MFLCTYLVTQLGGPPIANQLVGAFLFAPMVLGTVLSARVRTPPHKLVLITKLALLPISVVMAGLVSAGAAQIWMVYPFMFAYGLGGLVNITAQRELFFTMAGPLKSARVLNTEVTGTASAMMLGPLLGGTTIQVFGLGAAFAVLVLLLTASLPLLWYSTRAVPPPPAAVVADVAAAGRTDWRLLRDSPVLVVVLVVTVICNLCYFAFMPLVPVIAEYLRADAAMAGVIGAMAGLVQLVVAAAMIFRRPRRAMRAYLIGTAICLCCLAILSQSATLTVALLVLAVAGVGQALFGSTQATLSVDVVAPHQRVAALGLLSTTIGVALPTGMVLLGAASSLLGARQAMLVSALVGLAALATTRFACRSKMRSSDGPIGVGREGNPITAQSELG